MVLLGSAFGNFSSLDRLSEFRNAFVDCRFLTFTNHRDTAFPTVAIAAGAHGFVSTYASPEEVRGAIDDVLSGKTPVVPYPHPEDLTYWQRGNGLPDGTDTSNEQRVLYLLCSRLSHVQIAAALQISLKTVEFHTNKFRTFLRVRGTREVVDWPAAMARLSLMLRDAERGERRKKVKRAPR